MAYFAIFTIIHDTWADHKALLLDAIEKRQAGQSIENCQSLHIIHGTALSKSGLTIAVAPIGKILFIARPPPFLTLIIVISTYIPFNLFKINILNRIIQHR